MMKRLLILVSVILLISANYSFAAMGGLIGAWTFDNDEDGIVKDSSGNGHNGELMGNAKIVKDGKYGSAVSTDGTVAYIMIPDDPDFEFDGDFTLTCWIWNKTPAGDHSSFITKGYHTAPADGGNAKPWYLVYYLATGTVDFFLRDTSDVNSRAVGKTAVNDGEWHHIVSMKDGNKVKIYIDGKEDGVADAVDAKYGENSQPLIFMVHHDRWFTGMIDEVAIFNKALNNAEINAVMGGLNKGVLAVSSADKLSSTWGNIKKD